MLNVTERTAEASSGRTHTTDSERTAEASSGRTHTTDSERTAEASSGRTHTTDLTHCTAVTTPASCSGNPVYWPDHKKVTD